MGGLSGWGRMGWGPGWREAGERQSRKEKTLEFAEWGPDSLKPEAGAGPPSPPPKEAATAGAGASWVGPCELLGRPGEYWGPHLGASRAVSGQRSQSAAGGPSPSPQAPWLSQAGVSLESSVGCTPPNVQEKRNGAVAFVVGGPVSNGRF